MPAGAPTVLMPPTRGVQGSVPRYAVPDGYLWRGNNVIARFGRLITRAGFAAVNPTGPGARLSGGVYFHTVDEQERVIAATQTKWYRLNGGVWSDISGSVTFTTVPEDPTRFTVFQSGGVNYAIGVNNHDGLYSWDGDGSHAVAHLTNAPTAARDITAVGNYVVIANTVESAVRHSVRVRWSDFNDHTTWPALNLADLVSSGAGKNIVAVRALGRLAMIVYLEESVWLGDAQAGVTAFRFEQLESVKGPCSPSCVVAYGSKHYYLAQDGRIYQVDGYRVTPISDPADYFLQTSGLSTQFVTVNRSLAWGEFNSFDREIYWFYPTIGEADPSRAISYNVDTGALHFHSFGDIMTAGWRGDEVSTITWADLTGTWNAIGPGTYPTWSAFGGSLQGTIFLGSSGGQVYRMRHDGDDNGAAITAYAETPLNAWGGLPSTQHVDGAELFIQQIPNGPGIQVTVGTSEALAEFPGPVTYVPIGTHDSGSTTRQKLTDNTDTLDGRFCSLRFDYMTHTPVSFEGGLFYVWSEAVS
jgi:hypothetical protein